MASCLIFEEKEVAIEENWNLGRIFFWKEKEKKRQLKKYLLLCYIFCLLLFSLQMRFSLFFGNFFVCFVFIIKTVAISWIFINFHHIFLVVNLSRPLLPEPTGCLSFLLFAFKRNGLFIKNLHQKLSRVKGIFLLK
jgi:hypothetical protein